jgi:hypothetical protein
LKEYYSAENLKRIKEANNYKQLLGVAMEVLLRIRRENPLEPIAMVCGPISTGGTGSRDKNLKIFDKAIERLSADGLLIFSQMPFEEDMERIYKSDPDLQGIRLLEEFYLPIFKMKVIKLLCFLSGWEDSIGAQWEHTQAKQLGIPIIYLGDYYIIN